MFKWAILLAITVPHMIFLPTKKLKEGGPRPWRASGKGPLFTMSPKKGGPRFRGWWLVSCKIWNSRSGETKISGSKYDRTDECHNRWQEHFSTVHAISTWPAAYFGLVCSMHIARLDWQIPVVHMRTFCAIFNGLRLCYAQSHSDDIQLLQVQHVYLLRLAPQCHAFI